MLNSSAEGAGRSEPAKEMDIFSNSNPEGAVTSPPISISIKREDEQTAVTKRVRFVPVAPLDEGDVTHLCGINGCRPPLEPHPTPHAPRPTPHTPHHTGVHTAQHTAAHPPPTHRPPSAAHIPQHHTRAHCPLFHRPATHAPPSRARASGARSAGTTPGSAACRPSLAERGASATRRSRLWNTAVVSATAHYLASCGGVSPDSWLRHTLGVSHRATGHRPPQGPMVGCGVTGPKSSVLRLSSPGEEGARPAAPTERADVAGVASVRLSRRTATIAARAHLERPAADCAAAA